MACKDRAPITRNKFNAIYKTWRQRIEQADILIRWDTEAPTKVPEFTSLVGLGEPAVPFLLERLKQGDFVAVRAIEAVSRVPSRRLYPNPMPRIGTFGEQATVVAESASRRSREVAVLRRPRGLLQ
jgi:hypothetical protein